MYVIGTAGHVDHGKSLLVERLTGIDPDRLQEEKQRGMTIDLGFAWMTLPSGRTVSIIDVPGHERFIKNMLAGADGIDVVLLVVAADDGVMPQTREHLAIVDLLGARHGVVALTKADLVEREWLEEVSADIAAALRGTALDGASIVACSSVTGQGLDELRGALDAAIDATPPREDRGRPRLPIDRVFTIDGFGTVVTGTLIDGHLRVGDEVEVAPAGLRGRVRGLQSHKDAIEVAKPGSRVAVNVAGIRKEALERGLVLAAPEIVHGVTAVDAQLRSIGGARAVRHNMHVTFFAGAAEALAQVRLLDADELRDGAEGWAQLKLASPMALLAGDHFVIRTPKETIGGGTIVAIDAKRHRRRDPRVLDALSRRESNSAAELVLGAMEGAGIADARSLATATGLSIDETEQELRGLVDGGAVRALDGARPPRYLHSRRGAALKEAALETLRRYHAQHTLRAQMPVEELRAALAIDGRDLAALLPAWDEVRVDGAGVALAGFEPSLDARQELRAAEVLAAIASADPPGSATIEATPELLAYLATTGRIVDAGDGVIFERAAYDRMVEAVHGHILEHGGIALGEARTLLGTNRRIAQAFLEHLDRARITRRVGEVRVWRAAS